MENQNGKPKLLGMMTGIRYVGYLLLLLLAAGIAIINYTSRGKPDRPPLVPAGANAQDRLTALSAMDPAARAALEQRETAAYLANPLDREALQNLVVLRDVGGSRADAEAIALALSELSRRNIAAQLSAIQIDVSRKDFAKAFERVDGVLRARPEQSELLFPVLSSIVAAEGAASQLGASLRAEQPWRQAFVNFLLKTDPGGSTTYNLFREIRKAGGTVTDPEKRTLLLGLYAKKLLEQAYFIWLDMLPKEDLVLVRNVFDGGFVTEPKNMLFDWNVANRKTARISVAPRAGKPADRVLQLDAYEDRDGGAFASQLMRLSPGSYLLTFDVQIDELKNERGLVWRMRCIESGQQIAETSVIKDKGPWESRRSAFTVPDTGCATQLMQLEHKGTTVPDYQLTARIAFDNFAITDSGEVAPEGAEKEQN